MAYAISSILSPGDSNTKLRKSNKVSGVTGYKTWGISLAPARESGYQMCAASSRGCREACLYHQGRGQCDMTAAARIARTIALHEHPQWFDERLRQELEAARKNAAKEGLQAAIRFNVLSDYMWEKKKPWIFREFPNIQGYEYSKLYKRMLRFLDPFGGFPSNYDLTFSRSERNEDDCLEVLRAGGNVAVVFRSSLPTHWKGFPVVNGDETDLRFLDPKGEGHVIAVLAKGSARHDVSGFVVDGGMFPLPTL